VEGGMMARRGNRGDDGSPRVSNRLTDKQAGDKKKQERILNIDWHRKATRRTGKDGIAMSPMGQSRDWEACIHKAGHLVAACKLYLPLPDIVTVERREDGSL